MASCRAILLFLAATIFVDQVFALSSYEAERQARRVALLNQMDDSKDPEDVTSLRRCVRELAGDVVAIRRSLRDLRRSEGGAFNTGMGQMQENEMQMQLMVDTDDLQNNGNVGQFPPGTQMNAYPNSVYPNPQTSPFGGFGQQPQPSSQQPQVPPYQYGMPENPMGMFGSRAYGGRMGGNYGRSLHSRSTLPGNNRAY